MSLFCVLKDSDAIDEATEHGVHGVTVTPFRHVGGILCMLQ